VGARSVQGVEVQGNLLAATEPKIHSWGLAQQGVVLHLCGKAGCVATTGAGRSMLHLESAAIYEDRPSLEVRVAEPVGGESLPVDEIADKVNKLKQRLGAAQVAKVGDADVARDRGKGRGAADGVGQGRGCPAEPALGEVDLQDDVRKGIKDLEALLPDSDRRKRSAEEMLTSRIREHSAKVRERQEKSGRRMGEKVIEDGDTAEDGGIQVLVKGLGPRATMWILR
jgi:hypothetical protein